eukprot:maker-scaffold_23-snap-gene-4.52-mRNA-1 protein AED:0.00 eAED:0.00 QI:27/1/1/1/1/1/2/20/260
MKTFKILSACLALAKASSILIWTDSNVKSNNEVLKTISSKKGTNFATLLQELVNHEVEQVNVFMIDELNFIDISESSGAYSVNNFLGEHFLKSVVLDDKFDSKVLKEVKTSSLATLKSFSETNKYAFHEETKKISSAVELSRKLHSGENMNEKVLFFHVGEKYTLEVDQIVKVLSKGTESDRNSISMLIGLETEKRVLQEDTNSTDFPDDFVKLSPNIFSGMLFSLMFFIFALIYLLCMDCIQTPQRFALQYPSKGKEFN